MAPRPPPQDEVSDGVADDAVRLRRSPRRSANSNVAGGKGKQKKDTPARKQLNSATNDGGKGEQKQKEATAGKKQGSATDGARDK